MTRTRSKRVYGPERAPALVAFAGGTAAATFELIARLGIDCDAIRGGFVQPAVDTRSLAMLERRCAQWERRGAPVEVLNADGMTRLLGSDAYVGGWIDRRGGTLHPLKYVRGLAGVAAKRGVGLFTGSRATRIERKNQRWRVSTGTASVTCDALALLTNAYSDGLWPGLGPQLCAGPQFSSGDHSVAGRCGRHGPARGARRFGHAAASPLLAA